MAVDQVWYGATTKLLPHRFQSPPLGGSGADRLAIDPTGESQVSAPRPGDPASSARSASRRSGQISGGSSVGSVEDHRRSAVCDRAFDGDGLRRGRARQLRRCGGWIRSGCSTPRRATAHHRCPSRRRSPRHFHRRLRRRGVRVPEHACLGVPVGGQYRLAQPGPGDPVQTSGG
jgi:hypothetical protein